MERLAALGLIASLLAACDDNPPAGVIAADHTRVGPVSGDTELVWTGSEFGLATSTALHRLSSAAQLIASEPLPERRPLQLDVAGDTYSLVAADETEAAVVFERYSADGTSLGPPTVLAPLTAAVDVERSETEYAVASGDAGYLLSRFDVDGQPVAAPLEVDGNLEPPPRVTENLLVWTGAGYVALWSQLEGLFLLALSPEGIPLDVPKLVLADVDQPQVLWTGQDLAIIARRLGVEPVFFRADTSGQVIGELVVIDGFDCCRPDTFRAIDVGYVVAGAGDRPVLAKLDGAGEMLELIPVGSGGAPAVERLVWTGEEIGLAYSASADRGDRALLFQLVEP